VKVPIRMISIATSFFWIFLIIFCASAMYSMKDIKLSLGEPYPRLAPDNEFVLSLPLVIVNRGYYNLGYFNVSTNIVGENGLTVARGSTFIPVINKGESVNTTHYIRLNLTDLLNTYESLFFNDTELLINATVSMKAAELIPVQVSSNLSVPWGAPLYNFTLGLPELTACFEPDSTPCCRAIISIDFENHAFFDVNGTVQVYMYNSMNALIGEGQTHIDAQQHLPYHGSLELRVPPDNVTANGHLEVFFATSLFNYGPVEVTYGH
jgi:hypothetical protein